MVVDHRRPYAGTYILSPIQWRPWRTGGIQVQRVLTDNGSCYRVRAFAQTASAPSGSGSIATITTVPTPGLTAESPHSGSL